MLLENLRKQVLDAALNLIKYRLVTLTGGNVSGRDPETGLVAITPSGMEYEGLTPEDIVVLDLNGNIVEGKWKPSVDTKFHIYIYKNRRDINSVIHTHSTFASCFAALNEEIPCVVTTLANEVGGSVPVARYTPVGTDEMGPAILEVIGDKRACLLANHGVVAVGPDVRHALVAAVMLEDAAKVYFAARCIGKPIELPESEVIKAKELFLYKYGQK
ncbi:L-ribulose-5-phosphate 4-epimerase [Thermovenabulum gondwanense]|uniref:L-ribulose-5-phosphate 4-epimerase n=1 Tax=Thermovenabulum gondwanense TaxID=520767 RepID=A0A161PW36_9FIRM|nr:L-ribulose-5-phosphate 4-epimerase [Thermovenabulum gondwanense]KYO65253.1 L-ribulose-5-phosphate 4-epimerase UlaF [Thermovenabulum gondwanense]